LTTICARANTGAKAASPLCSSIAPIAPIASTAPSASIAPSAPGGASTAVTAPRLQLLTR